MKKKDFDDRLQNDLFPEMPASFERGLQKTMEEAGVKIKKRPTATGVFAGAVSFWRGGLPPDRPAGRYGRRRRVDKARRRFPGAHGPDGPAHPGL